MGTHHTRTVREIMTFHPRTVRPETPVRTLRDLFIAHGFNAFPVVDETDTLLGIVTKFDLLRMFGHDSRRMLPDLRALWAERVEDIMRRGVVTVSPDDPVAAAMNCMVSSRLRSLPVVQHRNGRKRLVGIVSRGDVLRGMSLDRRDAS